VTAAPEAVIAAGMLAAAGVLDESLTRDRAAQRLAELLGDTTLWRRADLGADLRSPLTASCGSVPPSAKSGSGSTCASSRTTAAGRT
jgi:hypothetical protein